MLRYIVYFVLVFNFVLPFGWSEDHQLNLPTSREHYRIFDVDQAARQFLPQLLMQLDPESRQIVLQVVQQSSVQELPDISKKQVRKILDGVDWNKRQVLEQLVHRSHVLDMVPEKTRDLWLPIVHDALIFFLGHLSEDRLFEHIWNLTQMPPELPRGERILKFSSKIPTLQKIGQILARNEFIPIDIKKSLQALENSIRTTTRDQLVSFIAQDLGPERVAKYQLEFENEVLAEASVGAVMLGSGVLGRGKQRQPIVFKIIKPYAMEGLPEELEIIGRITQFFEEHQQFYGLGELALSEVFEDLKDALSDEIRVTEEQANFKRAYQYYARSRKVLIPEVYSFSTEKVTAMEFVHGEKIADAFLSEPKHRAKLARRLAEVMTVEPLFRGKGISIFHGDPHSGNVFHVRNDPRDFYRIGLLDWGLMGSIPRRQRARLVQLAIALQVKDIKRWRNHIWALIEGKMSESLEDQKKIYPIINNALKIRGEVNSFEVLGEVITELVKNGYKIRANVGLFIKSQITINGILKELDPDFDQDRYLKSRIRTMVLKEMPKRIVLLPVWNYHGYRSLLSNEDVKDYIFK